MRVRGTRPSNIQSTPHLVVNRRVRCAHSNLTSATQTLFAFNSAVQIGFLRRASVNKRFVVSEPRRIKDARWALVISPGDFFASFSGDRRYFDVAVTSGW